MDEREERNKRGLLIVYLPYIIRYLNSLPYLFQNLDKLIHWSILTKHLLNGKYSQTSIARTPMARLPWLIQTPF